MKHTFEIQETRVVRDEKVEVTFPHFRKYEFFSYKITDDKSQLCVTYLDGSVNTYGIAFDNICLPNVFRKGSYEITEEEFNETFKRTIEVLTLKIK
jgi:hypothetical protein